VINEIQRFIAQIAEGAPLSQDESSRAFQIIMRDGATPAQVAALLMGLRMKGETVPEITGAALVLKAKMEKIAAPPGAMDVCGTGGDAHGLPSGGTLNVSTAVALVVAGAGVPVVKHGNKSVSSLTGSADVLAALGVNVKTVKSRVEQCLKEANICFMLAPLFHKAMRHVAPIRQELGLRTLFNLLGPLVNPASPKLQLLGVYDKALVVPIAEVLRALGSESAWVVHGEDGMDELTLAGATHVAELGGGKICTFDVNPEEAGLARAEPGALKGGNAATNARELSLLLSGKRSAYRDIVLLNAAAALKIAGRAETLPDGVALGAVAIDGGRAKEALAHLVRITNLGDVTA
jgi:anthranilate phosphoribosyltransferase